MTRISLSHTTVQQAIKSAYFINWTIAFTFLFLFPLTWIKASCLKSNPGAAAACSHVYYHWATHPTQFIWKSTILFSIIICILIKTNYFCRRKFFICFSFHIKLHFNVEVVHFFEFFAYTEFCSITKHNILYYYRIKYTKHKFFFRKDSDSI